MSSQVNECRNWMWAYVKDSVTAQMNLKLISPFSVEELRKDLWSLPKDSCPGEDRHPVAF